MKSKKRIVLAYSGGLDTSIILKWLQENYNAEVICYTADIGQKIDRKKIITNAKNFGVKKIHSEYGMTELLSQAYSKKNGLFKCPPWMKVFTRDINDPLSINTSEKTGGLNIIDLANQDSCPFIATEDLGKAYGNKLFEVLGRFDQAEVRGCNLMVV